MEEKKNISECEEARNAVTVKNKGASRDAVVAMMVIIAVLLLSVVITCVLYGAGLNHSSASRNVSVTRNDNRPRTLIEQGLEDTSVPAEYRNALIQALKYEERSHMSKKRLFRQLTSEYGEGFTHGAASWALDHMRGVDWYENACITARHYQERQHMSKERIYRQLTSDYGEGFTESEASYAISKL